MTKPNSNLLCRTTTIAEKPQPERLFRFLENYGDKEGTMKYINYKPPKFIKAKDKWFIEYYFYIPKELRQPGSRSEWKRFKVYENINRFKTIEYANILLDAVSRALQKGYNPFKQKTMLIDKKKYNVEEVKDWTIQQGLLLFLQKWNDRGLDPVTISKYKSAVNAFIAWLTNRELQHAEINTIYRRHVELYLAESKSLYKWGNRNYNNHKTFLATAFNYLYKNDYIKKNPCTDIDKLRTVSKKHKYYEPVVLEKVIAAMKEHDPYLYFAAQVVYHLCIRSEKELSLLKVKSIMPDRMQVFISGEDSKTDTDRYIPMSDEILKVFKERKILDYDPEYYVFSVQHRNKFVKDGEPGPEPFGKAFFSKRFSKIRDKIGLSSDYTLYGFKHSRILHLKMDGVPDQDIMNLTGHRNYVAFSTYLRDIGLTANPDTINKHTRTL